MECKPTKSKPRDHTISLSNQILCYYQHLVRNQQNPTNPIYFRFCKSPKMAEIRENREEKCPTFQPHNSKTTGPILIKLALIERSDHVLLVYEVLLKNFEDKVVFERVEVELFLTSLSDQMYRKCIGIMVSTSVVPLPYHHSCHHSNRDPNPSKRALCHWHYF